MKRVYLDYNATTPVEPEVLDAMLPYFSAEFGNASSIHTFGQTARAAVEKAREQVAALIGAQAQEIFFTSGGTESDNHAIFGIVSSSYASSPSAISSTSVRPHIITSLVEHEAVLNVCQALEKQGVDVTYLHVDQDGSIDPQDLQAALRKETVRSPSCTPTTNWARCSHSKKSAASPKTPTFISIPMPCNPREKFPST